MNNVYPQSARWPNSRGDRTIAAAASPSTELADHDSGRFDLVRSKPLVAAIARELWKVHGGNEVLNWLEAEILLQNALACDECEPGMPGGAR